MKISLLSLGASLILFSLLANAEEGVVSAPANAFFRSCGPEISKLCSGQTDFRVLGECLVKDKEQLSISCKQEIERVIQARTDAASRGGGALTSFGALNALGPALPLVSYEGIFLPGENGGPSVVENKANLSVPVYKSSSDAVAVSLAAGQLDIGHGLTLDSGVAVPTTLSRFEIGSQFSHQYQDRRMWGLRASAGYAGDEPFVASGDDSFSLTASYGFPGSEKGYWVLLVLMANNSPLLNYVPIPGFLYIYKSQHLSGMFGFPITAVQWTPVDPWVYSLSIFGPIVQLEAAYGYREKFQVFCGYTFTQQSYIPSVREDNLERLKVQEERGEVGFRFPIVKDTLAEFQFGRSFDRSIYLGKGFLNKDYGSVSLPAAWFVSWSGKYAF